MRALLVPARRDERGAVVPIVAVLIGLLITVTALTVDLGTQRVARTDMQSLADLVALDASRSLGGQTTSALLTGGTFATGVVASVGRNSSTVGAKPTLVVEIGTYAGTTFTPSGSLRYTAGDAAVSAVTITTGATVPTAVRVSTGTTTSFSFVPGTGAVNRSAVAVTDSSACFEVGSYAAAVRSSGSALLNPLLSSINSNLNLTTAGYQGLATTSIKLADLATALGVGSVQQLATATVRYTDFYAAVAQVLSNNGQTAYVSLLQSLSTSVSSSASFAVASLLTLDTGAGQVAKATANVLDLVSASAFLLNGSTLLDVPAQASVPGVTGLSAKLKLIQAIQKYCGRVGTTATPASTSQVDLSATATLSSSTLGISGVGTVSISAGTSPVSVAVAAAPTTAQLASVTCTTPTSSVQGASLALSSGLLTTTVTVPLRVQGSALSLLGLGGLVNVDIRTSVVVSTTVSPTSTTFTITIPPKAFDTAYSTGTSSVTLGGTTTKTGTTVSATLVLGLVSTTLSTAQVDSILDPVVNAVVAPLVSSLSTALVSPLLTLLGIEVAGADVILDSTPPLSCSVPSLRQ